MDTQTMEPQIQDKSTFTFTARNVEDPERLATFTLQNGSVAVQLGDALVEHVESALDTINEEQKTSLRAWLKPVSTGAAQAAMKPIPVQDFNANMTADGDFRTTAWVRAAGLRLAPLSINWEQVDNPQGAAAFVEELERRRNITPAERKLPNIFDYWATWMLVAGTVVFMPLVLWRYLSGRK